MRSHGCTSLHRGLWLETDASALDLAQQPDRSLAQSRALRRARRRARRRRRAGGRGGAEARRERAHRRCVRRRVALDLRSHTTRTELRSTSEELY